MPLGLELTATWTETLGAVGQANSLRPSRATERLEPFFEASSLLIYRTHVEGKDSGVELSTVSTG
jgi:hypothetical protein